MSNLFKIAVLISGGGTTLKNLIDYKTRGELDVEMALVVSNKSDAGGLKYAAEAEIPTAIVNHKDFDCLLYTSPSPRDQRGPRMPSSA